MNCTICGKPTRPGATLCVPCRKALKRARYESVLDLSPLQGNPGPSASAASQDAIDGLPAASSPRAILGARTTRLWTAVGILVVGSAIVLALLQGSGSGAHPVARAVVAQSAQEPERASNDAMSSAAQRSAVPPGALFAANSASSSASAGPPSPSVHPGANGAVTPAADVGKGATPARPANAEASPRLSPKTTVAINAIAEENTPIDAFGPVAPTPRNVEAPPVVKPPPPVDRWQLLAGASARCDGDFFARVGCEQRARSQYCENYWGLVPQCPAVAPTEHGQ